MITRSMGVRKWLFPAMELVLGLLAIVVPAFLPAGYMIDREEARRVVFLVVLTLLLGQFVVRLEVGSLRLTMIGTVAAALVLPPGWAMLVGAISALSWLPHAPRRHWYAGLGATMFWVSSAACLRVVSAKWVAGIDGVVAPIIVVSTITLLNWVHTPVGHWLAGGNAPVGVLQKALTRSFMAAFVYFSLAGILVATVLDGTVRGYALATIVGVLSVALTETLKAQQTQLALQTHVNDGLRHIAYTRALEGSVHNFRNSLAVAKGRLEDLSEGHQEQPLRGLIDSAQQALDEVLDSLTLLSDRTTLKVDLATARIDLNGVVATSLELVSGLARHQRARLKHAPASSPIWVRCDASLMKEVLLNLLLNSLHAVQAGGEINVTVSVRRRTWAAVTIADSGPGIADDLRERLFEPHFTTRPDGTGMGLFTSFGVVREHQGKLLYEGVPGSGAVFTVLLPLASSAESAKAVPEAMNGLDPARVAE